MPTGSFTYLDPPLVQVTNAPPPIPTFTDGLLVHQTDLNALATNVAYLQNYVLGGSAGGTAGAKPMTVLRAVTANTFTGNAATLILWDTADVDNYNQWNRTADPYTITVAKEGFHRIYFQCSSDSTSYEEVQMFILINGTDVANNTISGCRFHGIQGNLEVTVPLAATASIQVAYLTQTSHFYSRTYGGVRIEVEWIAPTIPVLSTTTT